MSEYDDDTRGAYRDRDDVREMVATQGWESLAQWVTEQARLETEYIVNGASSWDDYQRSVGRLSGFRDVLGRPDALVDLANELERGDTHG